MNTSLYEDNHPKTSTQGLGFKDAPKARYTIRTIKDRPIVYQKQVITTIYNRAYHHPRRNSNMEAAMKIFSKWMDKHGLNYKSLT